MAPLIFIINDRLELFWCLTIMTINKASEELLSVKHVFDWKVE
jgi:hypothetical protein